MYIAAHSTAVTSVEKRLSRSPTRSCDSCEGDSAVSRRKNSRRRSSTTCWREQAHEVELPQVAHAPHQPDEDHHHREGPQRLASRGSFDSQGTACAAAEALGATRQQEPERGPHQVRVEARAHSQHRHAARTPTRARPRLAAFMQSIYDGLRA